MGVIHVAIPGIVPAPATQGKGRDRKGRESHGLSSSSMTSGRGWLTTGRDHHQTVSASVMDGRFASSSEVAS